MGLGFPSVLLAWGPSSAAVLAAGVGDLINQPAVLLGAAVVVVVAVLIVLIMVLRGGSKKNELAEAEEDQGMWESAPRGAAAGQSGRGYDARDQMLPWEQGGGRAEGGRPSMSGRRGGSDQAGWGQGDQGAPQWQAQSQPSSRGGGQWVGTDEWVPPEVGAGRGNADPRGQGQMGARDNEGWPWAANQGSAGGPNSDRDQWGQPASAPMGRGGDQWGQSGAAPMGRGDDQWGQGPAVNRPMGREQDQWGQAAAPAFGQGRGDDQWGQGPASISAPRGDDQWGQRPGASHPMGREQDQWGQNAPARGRGQDQWGSPSSPNGYGAGQPEDQGFEVRGGPRRGAEPVGQAEGQWGQGGWGQANAGWGGNEPAGQWGQPAASSQPPQAMRPGGPGNSRPNSQGNLAGFGSQAPAASEAGSGWGEREAPAWQAEPSRREPPSWEAPSWQVSEPEPPTVRSGSRTPSGPQPQWEQPGRGAAEAGWESPAAAGSWGQSDPTVRPSPSRPIEPAAPRGVSHPGSSGGEWGQDFERPTSKPGPQAPGWEQREAPAWATPASPADVPTARPSSGGGRLSRVNPEATAYAAPAPEVGEGADKTVIIRKDAGAVRTPSVVVRQGKEPGRSYEMRKDHLTIGRSRESDVFLEDLAVSRLHATIYRDEMGGYLLRDENSANGTTVNGQRITEVALQEGDEIQLGQTILAFVRR